MKLNTEESNVILLNPDKIRRKRYFIRSAWQNGSQLRFGTELSRFEASYKPSEFLGRGEIDLVTAASWPIHLVIWTITFYILDK